MEEEVLRRIIREEITALAEEPRAYLVVRQNHPGEPPMSFMVWETEADAKESQRYCAEHGYETGPVIDLPHDLLDHPDFVNTVAGILQSTLNFKLRDGSDEVPKEGTIVPFPKH